MKKSGIEQLKVEITTRPERPYYGPNRVDVDIRVTAPVLNMYWTEYAPVKESTSLTPEGEAIYGMERAIREVTFRAYEQLFSKMPEIDDGQTEYSYVSKSMEGFADVLAENLGEITVTKTEPRERRVVGGVLVDTWFTKEEIRKIQSIASKRKEQIAKEKRKQEHFTNKTINYTYSGQG